MEPMRELDLRDLACPKDILTRIIEACHQARLVLARTASRLAGQLEFWDAGLSIAQRVSLDENVVTGRPTGEIWSDISFDPAFQNCFRHSSSAQPLHTDGSYISDPPTIVFMVCKRPAPTGGATLFLDGPELLRALSSYDPVLLQRLATEPVLFEKGGSVVSAPIISSDSEGPLLRWNYYALSKQLAPNTRNLVEAFHKFLCCHLNEPSIRAIRLEQGDAVFFHDKRLLHGRASFTARVAGDRFLWKGGLRISSQVGRANHV